MDQKKQELIDKLKKIKDLYSDYKLAASEVWGYTPPDNYPRKIKVPPHPGEEWGVKN